MHRIGIVFTAGTCSARDAGNETIRVSVFFLPLGLTRSVGRADGTKQYGIVNIAKAVLAFDAKAWDLAVTAKKALTDHISSSLE